MVDTTFDFDWLVIGSGFGGSVSALRLTEKGYRVGVLECGRRFAALEREHGVQLTTVEEFVRARVAAHRGQPMSGRAV